MDCPNITTLKRIDPSKFQYRTGEVHHLGKKHIYLDFDLTEEVDRFDEIGIENSHRVHIFFANHNQCIDNDKLADFIVKCGEVTNRPVIVHVPSSRSTLAKLVKGTVYYLDNCRIVEEANDKRTTFVNKDETSPLREIIVGWTGITVAWSLED